MPVVIKIHGGLGNQLFQIAFALGRYPANKLRIDRQYELRHRPYILPRILRKTPKLIHPLFVTWYFHILPFKYRKGAKLRNNIYFALGRLIKKISSHPSACVYNEAPMEAGEQRNLYFDGYWQKLALIEPSREKIVRLLKNFKPRNPLEKSIYNLAREKIHGFIHIRKGDYTAYSSNGVHPILNDGYYNRAIAFVRTHGRKKLVVFSDDIDYAKNLLRNHEDLIFVENSISDERQFLLMRQFNCAIIANSTFSWWAAFSGNAHEDLVVAPALWLHDSKFSYADLIPNNWYVIHNFSHFGLPNSPKDLPLRESPKVAVIIPTYNAEAFVESTIRSAHLQTYKNLEICVVDDCSTDNTTAILERLQAELGFKLIRHAQNRGLSESRNTGITNTKAPFIAILDSDDIWISTKIERQMSIFLDLPSSFGAVASNYHTIDPEGRISNVKLDKNLVDQGPNQLDKILINNVFSGGSSALIQRRVFDACGLFRTDLFSCEDWEMWIRIARKFDIKIVPEALLQIRKHPASMSKNDHRMYYYRIIVLRESLLVSPNHRLLKEALDDVLRQAGALLNTGLIEADLILPELRSRF